MRPDSWIVSTNVDTSFILLDFMKNQKLLQFTGLRPMYLCGKPFFIYLFYLFLYL